MTWNPISYQDEVKRVSQVGTQQKQLGCLREVPGQMGDIKITIHPMKTNRCDILITIHIYFIIGYFPVHCAN